MESLYFRLSLEENFEASWGNDKLSLYYSAAENINKVFGHTPPELSKLNQKMEKQFYKAIKKKFANSAEIIGLL